MALKNNRSKTDVTQVFTDSKTNLISMELFIEVQNFIDKNYIGDNAIFCCKEICLSESNVLSTIDVTENRQNIAKEMASIDVDAFINESAHKLNFQNTLLQLIADRHLENSAVYTKAFIDRKFFSKIISKENYIPKKMTVMALGLALELKIDEYESFLASAGYAFMPSSRFDLIIKFCVIKQIYNLIEVDMILDTYGESCFAFE